MSAAETAAAGGRTRWRIFALIMAVGLAGIGVLAVGLSQGALAASFAVSGVAYKATADKLDGAGVVQFGDVDRSSDQAHPVLVNGFQKAKLDNFCQSILLEDLPVLGEATIKIQAPGAGGMQAENLIIGIQNVTGNLTLNNVEIGRDAGTFSKAPAGLQGTSGGFGIQADTAQLTGLKQTAWSTTASTLRLNQVHIETKPGRNECY